MQTVDLRKGAAAAGVASVRRGTHGLACLNTYAGHRVQLGTVLTLHRVTIANGAEIASPGRVAVNALALVGMKLATVAAVGLFTLADVTERSSPPRRAHNALAGLPIEDTLVAVLPVVEALLESGPAPWLRVWRRFVTDARAALRVKSRALLARAGLQLSSTILTTVAHLGPSAFMAVPALPHTVTIFALACFNVELTTVSAVADLKAAHLAKLTLPRGSTAVAHALLHLPLIHADLLF